MSAFDTQVEVDVQIALVGGIIGLVDFCLKSLPQSMPRIVKLSGRNFALLQHEDFIIVSRIAGDLLLV